VPACNLHRRRRRRREPAASKSGRHDAGFVSQGRAACVSGLIRGLVHLLGPGQEPQALWRLGFPPPPLAASGASFTCFCF
jgi:hypothetical protein